MSEFSKQLVAILQKRLAKFDDIPASSLAARLEECKEVNLPVLIPEVERFLAEREKFMRSRRR